MTKEERAKKEYPLEDGLEEAHWNTRQDYLREAYIKGATEQHKIDIEKACEWLRNNAVICLMNEEVEDFVEDFYKAMEE